MNNTYVYPLDGALYINLTNRCSNDCTFCIREGDTMNGYDLWLAAEPSAAEVLEGINQYPEYNDIVFCGYGEPTYRLAQLLEVAKECKKQGKKIRLNTNGLGSQINGVDITKQLAECIDVLSVSLNAPDRPAYDKVSRPQIENSFEQMLDFVQKAVSQGIKTVLTAVDVIGKEKSEECAVLAKELGAEFRLRAYIPPENSR